MPNSIKHTTYLVSQCLFKARVIWFITWSTDCITQNAFAIRGEGAENH